MYIRYLGICFDWPSESSEYSCQMDLLAAVRVGRLSFALSKVVARLRHARGHQVTAGPDEVSLRRWGVDMAVMRRGHTDTDFAIRQSLAPLCTSKDESYRFRVPRAACRLTFSTHDWK